VQNKINPNVEMEVLIMDDSILTSIKKLLGIAEEYEHFDADLIMDINSVFSILTQLGVGPVSGFVIEDKSAKWSSYTEDEIKYALVKSYIYLKVKLLFDPPLSSAVMECCRLQISEYEWRLNVMVENEKVSEEVK
jgi:hypothetical protein